MTSTMISVALLLQESGAEKTGEAFGRVIGWVIGIVFIVWIFKMLSRKK